MQTGLLVHKGTYGLCIMVGGLLWSTGSSLGEKLLSSLVSAIVASLCLSHTHWVAFCQSFAFILLSLQCTYAIIKVIFSQKIVYIVIFIQVYVHSYEFITNHLVYFFCFLVCVDLSVVFSSGNFLTLTLRLGPLSTVGFAWVLECLRATCVANADPGIVP